MKNNILISTNFNFPNQTNFYKGKVRDVYTIENDILVMIVTDRISAFDTIMQKGIPYKGQILNQLANICLDQTQDIVPNWKIISPDANVTIGKNCSPFKIEMVIRGYLIGHAWRLYKSGLRKICGEPMPNNLRENEQFITPIITPTIKSYKGHDEDISKIDIIKKQILSLFDYEQLEDYTKKLYQRGCEIANKNGLILMDTKYEFGKDKNGNIILIDEIHTPDSSRYFYKHSYEYNLQKNIPQKQLSKEFLRQWLIENNFQGKKEQNIPEMTTKIIKSISDRYIELYEILTAEKFIQQNQQINIHDRINLNIIKALKSLS